MRPVDHPQIRGTLPLQFPDGTPALACELSAKGMVLRTSARLRIGQALALELRPPESALVFTAKGIVVNVDTRKGAPGVSILFTDLRVRRRP
jgi:hypothetical protein